MSAEITQPGSNLSDPSRAKSEDSFPRYERIGDYPVEPPVTRDGKPIRVALVYAVCYRFRMPIFRRLSAVPSLQLRLLVGTGVPGTKLSNAPDRSGLDVRILWTIKKNTVSTGRSAVLFFNPTLPFHLMRFNPDVILIQGGLLPNNVLAWIYALLFRKPIVWWSLGEVRGRQFRGLSAVYRRMTKWVERRSTAYLGYSSAAIDYFLKEGYPRQRCFNLINVVDTDLVAKQMKETEHLVPELRERFQLNGQRVLLFVGTLSETKGIDTLIRAYTRLELLRENTKLLIVGDGPELEKAEQLALELGVDQRVIFTGAVYENVSAYFQVADLMVLPGTGGLAISEGMAHGLPIICSIGDGVEVDLVDEGQNGFHVPPLDEQALVDRMTEALSSTERLKEMGQHSLRIVREKANISRYLNEMMAGIYCAYEENRR